mgnify:CR=1 FL=1
MGDLPRREREAFSFGERAAMELLVKKVLGSDLGIVFLRIFSGQKREQEEEGTLAQQEIFLLRFGQLRLVRGATLIRETQTQPRPASPGSGFRQ